MKILVIAGKKQAGKTTATNFVVGYTITQLRRSGIPYLPKKFTIDPDTGDLVVDTWRNDLEDEKLTEGSGILDLYSQDPAFLEWANSCMYPYVKPYAYGDLLKAVLMTVFGISNENLNGTNEQKDASTHIPWKNMCALLPPKIVANLKKSEKYNQKMSGRELMQYFGTDVCRKIYPDCWVRACFDQIMIDQPQMAIISDARFENEIKIPKTYRSNDIDVKIIKLERSPHYDVHDSELKLDKLHANNFNLIVPKTATIKEMNQQILEAMYKWKWFDEHMNLENING